MLTREDLGNRTRFLNARDTLLTLIDQRIIPVINENDTIATHEIRIGDNDNLSALVATLIEADLLILLTDQPGLFTADPRTDKDAQLIERVEPHRRRDLGAGGRLGDGLGHGRHGDQDSGGAVGEPGRRADARSPAAKSRTCWRGSCAARASARISRPQASQLESRKRWLLLEKTHGAVKVDAGAARKLLTGGASLLPVGITQVIDEFSRGETLSVIAPDGKEIAHGLTSYDSDAVTRSSAA